MRDHKHQRGITGKGPLSLYFFFEVKKSFSTSDGSLVGFFGMPVVPSSGELSPDCRLVQLLYELSKPQAGVFNIFRVLEDKPSRTKKFFTERKALQAGSWLVS